MAGKTVVVLGGGVGGLVTANELRSRLGSEHRVVLVDKDGVHIFWPSLLWLQVGLRKPESIVRDLASLERKGIEVMKGEVERIDPERRVVEVNGSELEADYLVVSLGAQLAPEQIPGLADAGHNLYSLDGAAAIRDARKELTEGGSGWAGRQNAVQVPCGPIRGGYASRIRCAQAKGARSCLRRRLFP